MTPFGNRVMTASARAMAMVSAAQTVAAVRNRPVELAAAAKKKAISAARLAKELMISRQKKEWAALRAMNLEWKKSQPNSKPKTLKKFFSRWKLAVRRSWLARIRNRRRY